jgi:hypothetical protein
VACPGTLLASGKGQGRLTSPARRPRLGWRLPTFTSGVARLGPRHPKKSVVVSVVIVTEGSRGWARDTPKKSIVVIVVIVTEGSRGSARDTPNKSVVVTDDGRPTTTTDRRRRLRLLRPTTTTTTTDRRRLRPTTTTTTTMTMTTTTNIPIRRRRLDVYDDDVRPKPGC